jgi:hypothetical protein
MSITTDHSAEVSDLILGVLVRRFGEPAYASELAAGREVRPACVALFGSGHVLPAARGEEAMVGTRDELGAIREGDAMTRPDGPPTGYDARSGETRVPRTTGKLRRADGPVDLVSDFQLDERPVRTVCE